MRPAFLFYSFIVGATIVSNAESTLSGILGGGGLFHPHRHSGIFDEFHNLISTFFGGTNKGFNHFLDDFGEGIPSLLEKSFGGGNTGKVLGPLSQIPDRADLKSILGEKLQGREDGFGQLVKLAKKFCTSGKCEGSQKSGDDYKKGLSEILGNSGDKKFEGGLDGFISGLEGLIDPSKKSEIFKIFSKLPDDFNSSHVLGKDASHSVDGIFSREDILPILVKLSKSKCPTGCDKS